ncbi:HAD-IA family hydrolase [Propionicicella superfundia]|uniref:HAD-IA family hydrolase n=1 Tax=Propionicicella superfundia TaxID=348582 RepID=UPI00040499CB|nr:HAD-IA family hydrolase [Propionicicella superfundia]
MTRALILDCDGVLVDTERAGHLPAFNALFAHLGLPVRWDEATYARLLKITGGKERMRTLLTPEFVATHSLPADLAGQNEMLAAWHKWKTAYYTDLVESGALPGRTGIARLAAEALAGGWRVAVASTSAEPAVRANLAAAVGDLAAEIPVYAGDIVTHKKPAPDIYLYALDKVGATTDEAVVLEDSANGVESAVAAGLETLVTVSAFTADEDFTGAAAVLEDLGEPGSPARVLSDPRALVPDGVVTLATLEAMLRTRTGAARA